MIVIVKYVEGFIFGAYTKVVWRSENSSKLMQNMGNEFLFSLKNPTDTDPIMFLVRKHSNPKCILFCSNYGPSFGSNKEGLCELHISDNPQKSNNSHVIGFPSMLDDKGYTNRVSNGTERFRAGNYSSLSFLKLQKKKVALFLCTSLFL